MTRFALALAVPLAAVALAAFGDPGGKATDAPYPAPRGYVCYRATGPIAIDGKLDDAGWATVPWSEAFRDIEGDKKPDPPFRTRMKMTWGEAGLYVAAELEEQHVWATLKDHDAVIFHDNDFEVFIDPDADGHLYGELELNALNTTWDLLLNRPYKDGGKAVDAWEITGLKTAVHVEGTINNPADADRGWTVEILWPWKSLRELTDGNVPPRDGDQWRINFSRVEWDHEVVDGKYRKVDNRKEHNWVWSPQGVIDMHRPDRWGVLQFSTAEPGKAELRPDRAQPARDFLHRVYYRERELFKERKAYAPRFDDLSVSPPAADSPLSEPTLAVTPTGFEATVDLKMPDGKPQRWRIDHEARVRPDRPVKE
ncbi:MAG TPA: carbohydrate-binding family 9-like protein [Gemmataceae bacterium]|nr:carbohydrate-binding family 9-like protein [Gemmataceae bacterium]